MSMPTPSRHGAKHGPADADAGYRVRGRHCWHHPPLRTVHDSFPSHGSGLSNAHRVSESAVLLRIIRYHCCCTRPFVTTRSFFEVVLPGPIKGICPTFDLYVPSDGCVGHTSDFLSFPSLAGWQEVCRSV